MLKRHTANVEKGDLAMQNGRNPWVQMKACPEKKMAKTPQSKKVTRLSRSRDKGEAIMYKMGPAKPPSGEEKC